MMFTKLNPRFARLGPPLFLSGQDLYTTDTVRNHSLGQLAFGLHGKAFRYASIGASALVVGNLLQDAAQDTQFENMAVLASPIVLVQNGLQTVNITNGTTTVVPNDFIDGTVVVYTAGGEAIGNEYTIQGITGTLTSGGAMVVTVDRPITVAWTTALKVVMKKSPWANTIQYPITTQTGIPVGVAIYANAAGTAAIPQYGWVQTHGIVGALSDNSTFAVGSMLSPSLAAAGAVGVNVAGTTHGTIGWAREAAASAHGISMFLMID